jgi:hypothetical protein
VSQEHQTKKYRPLLPHASHLHNGLTVEYNVEQAKMDYIAAMKPSPSKSGNGRSWGSHGFNTVLQKVSRVGTNVIAQYVTGVLKD